LWAKENWAGVVETGSNISKVSGYFTTPSEQNSTGAAGCGIGYDSDPTTAEWVGIGGWGNQSLWQAGIAYEGTNCYPQFWYEYIPRDSLGRGLVQSVSLPNLFEDGHSTLAASVWIEYGVAPQCNQFESPNYLSCNRVAEWNNITIYRYPVGDYCFLSLSAAGNSIGMVDWFNVSYNGPRGGGINPVPCSPLPNSAEWVVEQPFSLDTETGGWDLVGPLTVANFTVENEGYTCYGLLQSWGTTGCSAGFAVTFSTGWDNFYDSTSDTGPMTSYQPDAASSWNGTSFDQDTFFYE
jgi:hypothetical protein